MKSSGPGEVSRAQIFTSPLMMSKSTRAAFETRWGPPGKGRLQILADNQLLDQAWESQSSWAIIPFEAIDPRWKVLRVDGLSHF